jgi:hypothetical protein
VVILLRIRKAPARARFNASEKRAASDLANSPAVEGGHNTDGIHSGHTYTKTFLWILVISSLLIFARTLYRLAETAQGKSPQEPETTRLVDHSTVFRLLQPIAGVWGTASSLEVLFGIFEFAPVILSALLWLIRPLKQEMIRMSI